MDSDKVKVNKSAKKEWDSIIQPSWPKKLGQ